MFLKIPVIIMIRFGENNVLVTIYIIWAGGWGKYMVHLTLFCLLLIKTEKLQEHDQYLNQIIHLFDLTI